MTPSVTIVVPALDEEENLEASIEILSRTVSERFCDYELLIFDDGSTDRTGEIADQLAIKDSHIRVVHNHGNRGIGYSFQEGVRRATKDFVGWLPADINKLFFPSEIERTLDAVGKADFVMMYLSTDNRRFLRRLTSQGFVKTMNFLFGLKLKYYNGGNFYRRPLIQNVKMDSAGYMLLSSIVVRLIKSGYDFVEVGVENREDKGGSKAVHVANFLQVFGGMLRLFWDVRLGAPVVDDTVRESESESVPKLLGTFEA